jgi:hypothetical protein
VAQLGRRAEGQRRRLTELRARRQEAVVRWEVYRSQSAVYLEVVRGYCANAAQFLGRAP